MSRQPLTSKGAERLREELARLKKVDRPAISWPSLKPVHTVT